MVRKVVTPKPKYTEAERAMVYNAIVFVAKLLKSNGVNVIIDATANRRKYRDQARRKISRFIEAYVRCPLEVCIKREDQRGKTFYAPEGIYNKAFTRQSATVPGVGVPYEEPPNPEVVIDSDKLDPSQCAERILEVLVEKILSHN